MEHTLTIITWLYRVFIFLSIGVVLKFTDDILFDRGLNFLADRKPMDGRKFG